MSVAKVEEEQQDFKEEDLGFYCSTRQDKDLLLLCCCSAELTCEVLTVL